MPSQHNLGGSTATSLLEFDSSLPFHTFIRNLKLLRAGQVIVDFNIILEKDRVVFYGPPKRNKSRTVRGKVRLEVAGKLHVKEIMITLAGEFHIINDESTSFSDESPLQGTLFSTCILLANKRTLTPGIHEFYFEFLLPGDLPESLSSDLISCEYFLKAELVSLGSAELPSTLNKLVDVVDLTVQRAMLQNDERVKQGLVAKKYTGSIDKILDYEFRIPRIINLDADTFTFHARWDGLRVDNVKFWFVQIESLKGLQSEDDVQESLVNHKSKVLSGPFCFDMPKKEPLKLQSRPMIFQLPITEPIVKDYDLNNFEIRHKLIISIQMANKNKEIIPFSVPIMIESIVADTEAIPPPPCNVNNNHNDRVALFHFANKVYSGKSLLEDNNNQQKSSSLKRFIQAGRRNTTIVDHSNESTTIATSKTGSIRTNERTTFQFPRRTSSVVRNRSSNNNVKNSISTIIESASEYTVDESSNENSHTIATTATYTNNTENERSAHGFPQKGFHKPTFVTNSGNVIAEQINKFNHLLHRNRSDKKRASSASTAKFAPGLIEVISNMNPNSNNINNASLTT